MNLKDLFNQLSESQKIEFLNYERENPISFSLIQKNKEHFDMFLISVLNFLEPVFSNNFEKEFDSLFYKIWTEGNYRPLEYN